MRHYDFTFDFVLKLPAAGGHRQLSRTRPWLLGRLGRNPPLISIPTCKKPSKKGVSPRWEAAPGRSAPAQSAICRKVLTALVHPYFGEGREPIRLRLQHSVLACLFIDSSNSPITIIDAIVQAHSDSSYIVEAPTDCSLFRLNSGLEPKGPQAHM